MRHSIQLPTRTISSPIGLAAAVLATVMLLASLPAMAAVPDAVRAPGPLLAPAPGPHAAGTLASGGE